MPNRLKRIQFGATGAEVHVDVPLSNVAIDYEPPEMIADTLCPVVEVPFMSGSIPKFDRAGMWRVPDDLRAPGTEAKVVTRNVSSDSFLVTNHALKTFVTLEDRKNADPIYVQKLYSDGSMFLKTQLMLAKEKRVAGLVTSGTNVGSYSAVGSSWTDHANSDPLSDLQTALDNVQDSTGYRPNIVTFGTEAWRHFRRNTTVRNLIFGTNNGGGYPSEAQVADILGVEKINVGKAYVNTGKEGQAESLETVWGDHVLMHYAPPSPSIFVPSFMYEFRWAPAGVPNMQVERHPYDTRRKREEIELGYYADDTKVTGAELSFLVTNVTSST